MATVRMQRSAQLHFIGVAIVILGFGLIAVPLWLLRDTFYSAPLALLGLGFMFVGIVSGLGFGPLGHARDRALAAEDAAYRSSVEPK